jgi:hypothetical protein
MQEDLMNSKIISRAACLAELTSNPNSFFNCPDLHGGSGLPGGRDGSWERAAWSLEGGAGSESNCGAENGVVLNVSRFTSES